MTLLDALQELEDPRSNINKVHPLVEIIFLVIVAILSGAEGWTDINLFGQAKQDWLRQYLPYQQGIPSKDTIARVIRAIEPMQLSLIFIKFVNTLRAEAKQPIIAFDGKSLKHSQTEYGNDHKLSMLHTVGAYATEQGILLGSLKSQSKKYEPNTIIELLDLLTLNGSIVTADAMNCDTKVVDKICASDADYMLQIKDNQAKLKREIVAYLHKVRGDNPELVEQNHVKHIDAGHGRIETREYVQLPFTDWFEHDKPFTNLATLIEVTRTTQKNDKVIRENAYYISSLPVNVENASRAIRSHWGIENSLHYVLDVTFNEDSLCLSSQYCAEGMAILRRLCFNLAKLSPLSGSVKGRLRQAAWNDKARSAIIDGLLRV